MSNYSRSKVYKLVNDIDDEIYVGSTIGTLRQRKCKHKTDATKQPNRRVYAHLNAVGWDNVRIVLLQSVPCANRDELRAAEQHWIDLLRPNLNKNSAVDTCPHGRRQATCKECDGSSICEHGRQKNKCKQCGGKGICEHTRIRVRCRECSPFYCDYCQTNHAKGAILNHYKTKKHKLAYIAAYVDAHDEEPTEFPFDQLIH